MNSRRLHSGVVTVEAAIILSVFLMLVFGIIEFSYLIFTASSLVEASRFGTRHLIVNGPIIANLQELSCDSLPATVSCADSTTCTNEDGLFDQMDRLAPLLNAENIEVTYRCSSAGYEEGALNVYEVEVRLVGVEYQFFTPGILGFDASVTLPEFKTTRLSEDLETVPVEE